jgi:hypothetical protein
LVVEIITLALPFSLAKDDFENFNFNDTYFKIFEVNLPIVKKNSNLDLKIKKSPKKLNSSK